MKKLYLQEPTVRRMSQKGPNMQFIRKTSPEFKKIREAFVKDLDSRWVETDYSDIEKRIMGAGYEPTGNEKDPAGS